MLLALTLATAVNAADLCTAEPLSIAQVETAIPAFRDTAGLVIPLGDDDLGLAVSTSGQVIYTLVDAGGWSDASGHFDVWARATIASGPDGALLVVVRDLTGAGEPFEARLEVTAGSAGITVTGTVAASLVEGCQTYEIFAFAPWNRAVVLGG